MIKTKIELTDDANLKFADNNTNDISAADLRNFLLDFITSSQSLDVKEVLSPVSITAPEVDFLILGIGANQITLPLLSEFKQRIMSVRNDSGTTCNLLPDTGTIDGSAGYSIPGGALVTLVPNLGLNDWRVLSMSVDSYASFFDEDTLISVPILSQGTYYNIPFTLAGESSDFTISGDEITKVGASTDKFQLTASVSAECTGNNRICAFKVFKNGTALNGRSISTLSNNKPQTFTVDTVCDLTAGDVITFRITNLSTSADIEVTDISGNLRKL